MRKAGRPAKFDRDDAVDIALQAFWSEGYQANSVKALSERLGITRSSFYNAFESQEALFLEALERYLAGAPDRTLAQVPEDGSICALLTRTFRAVCDALEQDGAGKGCLLVNSVGALCLGGEGLGLIVAELVIERVERLEALLCAAAQRGELDEMTDVKALALALKTQLLGLNLMAKVVKDKSALWPAARTMLAGHGILRE
ncbi:TetR/AcrR family transcriptional regulator [Erythrobacter sp.]|uniref:TetR/AcrR family transcriptional regulator n=1 Tax=Erythrobacter sp. TaxID=1042 RepID=UPI00311EE6B7